MANDKETRDKQTGANLAKDIDREYLKKQMRERAATEAPPSELQEGAEGREEDVDTKADPMSTTLQETKEAIKQVAEKLEHLANEVAEPAPKSRSKKRSK